MQRPGFTYGWALGLLEVLGTCFGSFLERQRTRFGTTRGEMESPKKNFDVRTDYFIVVTGLMASSSLSNIALNYINFPTKVVFRSCKLIPTMGIAILVHRKSFSALDWAAAFCVCLGLVLVGVADASTTGAMFSLWGIGLVSLSVVADAITPNFQQRLFDAGESRGDVIFFTNVAVSVVMLFSLALSGDLWGAWSVAKSDGVAAWYMLIYASVSYVAISFHMTVVQRFGGVVGVLVGNGRKVLTIVLSFVAFPKPLSATYVAGVVTSLGGLTAAVIYSDKSKKGKRTSSGSNGGRSSDDEHETRCDESSLLGRGDALPAIR